MHDHRTRALADEAALLRRMAAMAEADGRDDLADKFRAMADDAEADS